MDYFDFFLGPHTQQAFVTVENITTATDSIFLIVGYNVFFASKGTFALQLF